MNTDKLLLNSEIPIIDISVVTYNSSQWIDKFFDSILAQNYPTYLLNIYITDNSSTDLSVQILKSVQDKYINLFHDFHIFERPNLGFGAGHDYNIKNSNNTYFLVTNVDLEFAPDSICQVVNTAIYDTDDVASWEFRQKPFEHPKYYNPVTLETTWSSHACILIRRSAYQLVCGYEKKIFMYGEDVELSYRLRDHGYRLKYCPKAVCWHYTYEFPNQVKALQFSGCTLANSYIRLRYGSVPQIIVIPFLYLALLSSHFKNKEYREIILINFYKTTLNTFYFLKTRKKSQIYFPFKNLDYEITREGAYYPYQQKDNNNLPLVSVIMRTYHGRLSYLKEAISSVLNQTYPNIELVIVEDGSDSAREYIEEISQSRYLKIIYRSEQKRGRCHTGNVGLSQATGDFFVFLDDDDLFFADHIEVLVDEILSHPNLMAVYTSAWAVATKITSLEPLKYEAKSYSCDNQPFSRILMWYQNYIPIQAILFKKELYQDYGGFDESLENLEDWNLWTRYSLTHDFLLTNKTTSLYRVPYEKEKSIQRQRILNEYYPLALEKQKNLFVTLSISEIVEFQQTIASYKGIVILPIRVIVSWMLQFPVLGIVLHCLITLKRIFFPKPLFPTNRG